MSVWVRPVLTLVAVLGAIGINGLSNAFPPKGVTVAELSNTVFAPVLMTPANYAFAIWGLIYLGLIALGVYQIQPAHHANPKLDPHSYWLVLASLAQVGWIYAFLNGLYPLSMAMMLGILAALIQWYRQLAGTRATRQERWLIHYPISLYLGWISVATIVNGALTLFAAGWRGGAIGPEGWTIALIAVAVLLAGTLLRRYQDVTFAGVVVWALGAIAVRHWAVPLLGLPAMLGAALLAGLILQRWGRLRPTERER